MMRSFWHCVKVASLSTLRARLMECVVASEPKCYVMRCSNCAATEMIGCSICVCCCFDYLHSMCVYFGCVKYVYTIIYIYIYNLSPAMVKSYEDNLS